MAPFLGQMNALWQAAQKTFAAAVHTQQLAFFVRQK
jgi:hypothetical protein